MDQRQFDMIDSSGGPRTWAVVLFLVLVGLGGVPCGAQDVSRLGSGAYGVQYRPAGVDYRVFETDHFELVYQTGAHEMAWRTATALEESWAKTSALIGLAPSDLRMPVVVNNYNDRSNGFVHPFPFRQEIEAPSIKSDPLVARSTSWPALVAPHELVHAAHAEVQPEVGVGGLLRPFAPDVARTINLLGPSGLIEGVAVYRESQVEPGAGRLNAPLFRMKMRAAMLSDDPWSFTQMMEAPAYTQPFNRFYIGGAHAFEYLAERGDSVSTDFFRSTVRWHNRLPFFGHGVWLGLSTGQFPYSLRNEIQDELRSDYRADLEARRPFTTTTVVAGKKGLNHRRPYWLDEETLVAYVHGYDVRPGFYRIDATTGERTLIRVQELTEDRTYSLGADTTALYAARYVPTPLVPRQAFAEVERVDLGTGTATMLTEGGRALAPAEGAGGRVYAVTNDGPFTRWSVVRDDGDTRPLTGETARSIRQVAPSPQDSTVAVLVNADGTQRLYRAQEPVERPVQLTPWFGLKDAIIYDVSWGPKGRYLLFAADLGGTANVYAYDTEDESVLKLANVQFGALEPALSPDRSSLAFINYQHERHNLVRLPFRPDSASVVPDSLVLHDGWANRAQDTGGERATATIDSSQTRPYSAWRHLAPRMVYPTLHGEGDGAPLPYLETPGAGPLGTGLGVGLQGSDPLQQWAYRATAYWQDGRLWGEARLQSGAFLLRPALTVYDRAETQCCVGAGRSVGVEERGAGLSLRLPITLASNAYQSLLRVGLDTEIHQTRAFGGPLAEPTPYTTRLTLNPRVAAGYRLQQNPRDIVPNTGLVFGAQSEIDAWTERRPGNQYVLPFLDTYLPVLRATNTGVRLGARALFWTPGTRVSVTNFVPRGYDALPQSSGNEPFLQLEAEVTQPLWFIDDGLTLLPLYAKALSVYGFGETLGRVEGGTWRHAFSSVGGGLSLQARIFYALDVNLRLGVAYKPQAQDVTVIGR